jgi:preprotein translocase subunit SecD
MPDRRPRLRFVAGAVALASLMGACSSSGSGKTESTATSATTTTARPTQPRAALEFREVMGLFEGSGPPCTLATTSSTTPNPEQALLFDRTDDACYLVGPVLVNGDDVDKATVIYDSTTSTWAIDVHMANNKFLTKVIRPLVMRAVAITVNDVVHSAPTINPGITGRDVQISSGYKKAEAIEIAASIMGVDPSKIPVDASGA